MSERNAEQHLKQVEKVLTTLGKCEVGGLLETDEVNEAWVQEMLQSRRTQTAQVLQSDHSKYSCILYFMLVGLKQQLLINIFLIDCTFLFKIMHLLWFCNEYKKLLQSFMFVYLL